MQIELSEWELFEITVSKISENVHASMTMHVSKVTLHIYLNHVADNVSLNTNPKNSH